jgi:hypothetical protein
MKMNQAFQKCQQCLIISKMLARRNKCAALTWTHCFFESRVHPRLRQPKKKQKHINTIQMGAGLSREATTDEFVNAVMTVDERFVDLNYAYYFEDVCQNYTMVGSE